MRMAWVLPPGVIHLYQVALVQPAHVVSRLNRLLSVDERERADRFRVAHVRDWFVVTRAVLRMLLGQYLSRHPSEITFYDGPYGKPALAEGEDLLAFSLSHSGGVALLALTAGVPVGVDIQELSPGRARDEMVRRWFTGREADAWRAMPPDLQTDGFFRVWTRKEAIKATGEGLAAPLSQVEVGMGPGAVVVR